MQSGTARSMTHRRICSLTLLAIAAGALTGCASLDDEAIRRARSATTGAGVDLTIAAVTGPVRVEPWGGFDAMVTACNTGSDTAWGFDVSVFVSTDSDVSTGDVSIGSGWVDELAPDACVTATVPVHVSAPDGSYVLGAIADPWDATPELDDFNNATAGASIYVGYAPDLQIATLTAPAAAEPWADVELAVIVCNRGTSGSSATQLAFYLSDDSEIAAPDAMIGNEPIPELEPDNCLSFTTTGYSSTDAGTWHVGAVIDPYDYATELDESNNTAVTGAIAFGNASDLAITALSSPPSVSQWDELNVSFTVCNHGTAYQSSTNIAFVLSTDDDISTDDPFAGSASLPGLDAGQCLSWRHEIHPSVSDGAYYLGALVNSSGCDQELDASNNTAVGGMIAVGQGPDLVVTSVSAPASVELWQPYDVALTVCNHGTSGSYGNHVELRLSDDATVTTDDYPAGSTPVPDLEAGHCISMTAHGHAGSGAGSYHLGAIVNPWGSQELSTTNNASAGAPIAFTDPSPGPYGY